MNLVSLTKKFIKETNKLQRKYIENTRYEYSYNPANYKAKEFRDCYKKYLLKLISYCAKNNVGINTLDGFRLWDELSKIVYIFSFSTPYPGINAVIKLKNETVMTAIPLYDRYNVMLTIDAVEKEIDNDSLAYLLLNGIKFDDIKKHLNEFFKSNELAASRYLKAKREGRSIHLEPGEGC